MSRKNVGGKHNICISEDAGPKAGELTRVWNGPIPPTLSFSSLAILSGQSANHCHSWVLKNTAGYKSWHVEGILTHCLLVL